jgi:hypothetical protein
MKYNLIQKQIDKILLFKNIIVKKNIIVGEETRRKDSKDKIVC